MFTGIVEADGTLHERTLLGEAAKLVISSPMAKIVDLSESIAINGTCLTVESLDRENEKIFFHVLEETLDHTNLGDVPVGQKVNMERPLQLGDRLGGHLVMGHVDAKTPIVRLEKTENDIIIGYKIPAILKPYFIQKGSVAIDGISLTVADLYQDTFEVHIIPYTWEHTNMCQQAIGDLVNIEVDMVGKYVLRRQNLIDSGEWTPDMNQP